jgi:pyruvate kinase
MILGASHMLLERGLAEPGDEIVFVAGVPPGVSRTTNVLKLHRVGEALRLA